MSTPAGWPNSSRSSVTVARRADLHELADLPPCGGSYLELEPDDFESMLELDRYGNRSTLVTSQMPVDKWHALIGDPTLGDAILDRLVHNAYRIELKGESMRRRATKLTATETSD